MSIRLEDLLPAAAESERGDPRVARAVYQRLQFLARVMRHAPKAAGCPALLLWLGAAGEVTSAGVTVAGVVIGRDAAGEVVLASPRVSRRHCAVRWVGRVAPELVIEDLGSSNGTYVNGRAVPESVKYPLQDGDVIEVGGVALAVLVPVAR